MTPATAHRHGGALHPSSHHYYTTLSDGGGDGDHNNHSMLNSMNNSMCYPHGTGVDGHLTHGCPDETNSNDSSTFSISPSLFASPNSMVKPPLGCNYSDAFNDMRSSAVKRQIFGQTLTPGGGRGRGGTEEGEGMGGCGGEMEEGEQRTPGRGAVTRSDAKNGLDILADGMPYLCTCIVFHIFANTHIPFHINLSIYIGCVSASERKEIPVPASPTVVACAEEKADRLTQLSPRRYIA